MSPGYKALYVKSLPSQFMSSWIFASFVLSRLLRRFAVTPVGIPS